MPQADKTQRTEKTVLVLQGGGALGAYQAGAFQELALDTFDPGWVAGISIGAINAALICGNPPERRVERLEAFWTRISAGMPATLQIDNPNARSFYTELASAAALATGAPGFFSPRLPAAMFMPGLLSTMTSFYDTSPLEATLLELVDFDYLNDRGPRLSVGAVEVESGNFAYFDSRRQRIGPEHVMASGALPPGFPGIAIDGRTYWDGGLVSNTPLQYVMETTRGETDPMCIFQVDLFPAEGETPANLLEVQQREKDIRYSSRTRMITDKYRELTRLSAAAERLYERLPAELKDDPDMAMLRHATPNGAVTLVHLIHRRLAFESTSKDYEFSRLSMVQHWQAGAEDVRRTLTHPTWQHRKIGVEPLQIFDLTDADRTKTDAKEVIS